MAERFPEAQPLPGRPAPDQLLRDAGLQLEWHAASRTFRAPEPPPEYTSSVSLHRAPTVYGGPSPDLLPALAAATESALRAERALDSSRNTGGFLVLATAPEHELDVIDELTGRFPVQLLDRAAARRIDWNRVIAADADPSNDLDWTRLKRLVAEAIPDFESRIRAAGAHVPLANPGLLARYGQFAVIDRLRDQPGRGIWLLAPGSDTSKPMIDGHAVPLFSDSQWTRLDKAWVENLHRGAVPHDAINTT